MITKLDRLGRSVKDLTTLAGRLQSLDVGLRVLTQGIDTKTPGGRLFFHMLAAVAEFEHDLIVERTREGVQAARKQGPDWWTKTRNEPYPNKPSPRHDRSRQIHQAGDSADIQRFPGHALSPSGIKTAFCSTPCTVSAGP